jgi:mono/diheme cytochrome c family protein
MNYPIWEVPASGLFIAAIAIVHVFVSHFAVGGGLFLVLLERRARSRQDAALLEYVRRHSRFFVLLTLVFGALTGVGIWFTIGLVQPAATSSLIQTFVWFWAIEWTFFVTEIAAALVYYYGWDRLSPDLHLRVGWIYFWSAWMSLAVINGILTFMLTPGDWPASRDVWAAFFNPTYWPGVVARSLAAVGLAGIYALLTASRLTTGDLKRRVATYAGLRWVLPVAVGLPLSLAWYLWAAAEAGVDVGGMFGASANGVGDIADAVVHGSASGHPIARIALLACAFGGIALVLLVTVGVLLRASSYGPGVTVPVMCLGLVTFGGAEFVREDLRKPWVIGEFMFVNGVRLQPQTMPPRMASAQQESAGSALHDPLSIASLTRNGVLATARYVKPRYPGRDGVDRVARQDAEGEAVFRVLCASCHTVDGYLAIRPLVKGRTVGALEGVIAKLAVPVDASGQPAAWDTPSVRLATWRGRRMPPFAGTPDERHALAVHLALRGGTDVGSIARDSAGDDAGRTFFDDNCSMCHGPDAQFPMNAKGPRTAEEYHDLLGQLPRINEVMPPFPGDEAQRQAVASHLASLTAGNAKEAR